MSNLRHRFRIVIDGTKYEIVTSARDMSALGPEDSPPAEQTWRLIHAACIRLRLPDIPSSWQEFADLLDDMDDLEPEKPLGELPNPTAPKVGEG